MRLDLLETARDQIQCFVPFGFTKSIAFADQGFREAIRAVDEIPRELALDARGNAVRGTLVRLDLQDVPVFGPNVETASDAAIRADRLGTP